MWLNILDQDGMVFSVNQYKTYQQYFAVILFGENPHSRLF